MTATVDKTFEVSLHLRGDLLWVYEHGNTMPADVFGGNPREEGPDAPSWNGWTLIGVALVAPYSRKIAGPWYGTIGLSASQQEAIAVLLASGDSVGRIPLSDGRF